MFGTNDSYETAWEIDVFVSSGLCILCQLTKKIKKASYGHSCFLPLPVRVSKTSWTLVVVAVWIPVDPVFHHWPTIPWTAAAAKSGWDFLGWLSRFLLGMFQKLMGYVLNQSRSSKDTNKWQRSCHRISHCLIFVYLCWTTACLAQTSTAPLQTWLSGWPSRIQRYSLNVSVLLSH